MSARLLVNAALVCAFMMVGASAAMANINNEIDKMANVINNSIPEKYRGQLLQALDRIASEASDVGGSCRRDDRRGQKGNCEIKKHSNGWYYAFRNNELVSSTGGDIFVAKAGYDQLIEAGLCERASAREACEVKKHSNGWFYTFRNNELISTTGGDIFTAAEGQKKLQQAGLCY